MYATVQDGRILKYEATTAHFVDFAFDSPTRLDFEHLPYECLAIDIDTDFNKLRVSSYMCICYKKTYIYIYTRCQNFINER